MPRLLRAARIVSRAVLRSMAPPRVYVSIDGKRPVLAAISTSAAPRRRAASTRKGRMWLRRRRNSGAAMRPGALRLRAGEPDHVDIALDPLGHAAAAPIGMSGPHRQPDVVEHGHPRHEREVLEYDHAVHARARDLAA